MRRVLERHAVAFRAMARFLGAGNEIVIVIGNHDAEFYWPDVQDTIREALVRFWRSDPRSELPGARTPEEVGAAISFHPWFFYEEGTAWIEHGHQYDPYCSFDSILDPVDPTEEQELDLNVSAAAMRYVRHLYPLKSSSDDVGFWEYLSWTGRQGVSGAVGVLGAFAAMNLRLLRTWWARTPEAIRRTRAIHLERLKALAARTRLSEEVLVALDEMRQRPSTLELHKLLRAVMLDRLVTTIVGSLLLLLSLVALPWGWVPLAVTMIMATMLGLDRRFASQRESIYPQAQMRKVARAIRKMARAPIVVFGHAHEPTEEALDDGGRYFNTGTWVAEHKERMKRAFTHLRIRMTPEGPRAELCQWRKGRSLTFHPVPIRS
jgi:UDP-2,3-diacylglucosamine pyrophosphatase LpxH